MNIQIVQIIQSLVVNGCVYIIFSDVFYDEQDWELMNQVLVNLILLWEKILIGDVDEENDFYVVCFMIDCDCFMVVNYVLLELIILCVCNDNVMSLFCKLMGDDVFYVWCMQVNWMKVGLFIGWYLDIDSNLDYQYFIVLQFGIYFFGGQFVVYDCDGNLCNDIKLELCLVIISDCSYFYEVQQVIVGECVLLVFFVSCYVDWNWWVY